MNWFSEILNVCRNLLQSYQIFSDTLDILLIAVVIYWLMSFVRRSNTANVLKGIVFLIAVLWLSKVLRLSVVSYLLGEAFSLGIIVVVVLFQPEIRRLLEQHRSSGPDGNLYSHEFFGYDHCPDRQG